MTHLEATIESVYADCPEFIDRWHATCGWGEPAVVLASLAAQHLGSVDEAVRFAKAGLLSQHPVRQQQANKQMGVSLCGLIAANKSAFV